VLAGCASSGSNRAPVEDRKPQPRAPWRATGRSGGVPRCRAGHAGAAGRRERRQAGLLHRQGRRHADPHRARERAELARRAALERIDNPNLIEVGQVLRVAPPPPDANGAVARPVQPAGRVDSRPLDARAARRRRWPPR
jgi:lipoprotein NlpD